MSNNNRSSNRRRGRGNNRSQGGNQLNRIDSRARGNAPQLLEKYRKLAHDAQLNGDRVQAEYYLQFADHYFRVIADSRAQKDETRARRDNERDQDEDDTDYEDEGDRGYARGGNQRRDNRERSESSDGERTGEDGDSDAYEAAANPFVREPREDRERGGRSRRPRKDAPQREESAGADTDGAAQGETGFDASILPPAIGKADEGEEEAPKPRKRRSTKPRGGDEQPLEAAE